MAGEGSDQAVQYVVLTCPFCHGKCRARPEAARKGLRCPRCRAVFSSPPRPAPDRFEDIELRRKRLEPLKAPLWLGVYTFPFHPDALRAWFLFGIGFSLVALMGAAIFWVIHLILTTNA